MINTQQKKNGEMKDAVSLITAGVVMGAGVAVAATLAIKDKKNQEKIKKVFSDVKKFATGSIEKLKDDDTYKTGTKKINETVQKVKTIS